VTERANLNAAKATPQTELCGLPLLVEMNGELARRLAIKSCMENQSRRLAALSKRRTLIMAIKFTEKATTVAAKPAAAKAAPQTAAPQEATAATKDAAKKPAKKTARKAPKSEATAESPLLDFNETK
jgi:uncharacterized protein involved in exopolysaccharide biosynthesis